MVYNVVIIGAGQLGSRHLQAIKNTKHCCKIWVVDSSLESLEKCKIAYNNSPENSCIVSISFTNNTNDVPLQIDFLLIATSASPRFKIFRELSETHILNNVVFEKVLFQRMADYEKALTIITNKKIKAWVNTPRRMFDFYKKIKHYFFNTPAHMFVIGGNWGLGCNSIHFIDLYSFLTGDTKYFLDTHGLNENLYDSKRLGYKEINGILCCNFSNGGCLILDSSINNLKLGITITSEKFICTINESLKMCWIQDTNGKNIESFEVPYQSQLTNIVLDDILENGTCELPTYQESDTLHRPFVEGILAFINERLRIETDICPLT